MCASSKCFLLQPPSPAVDLFVVDDLEVLHSILGLDKYARFFHGAGIVFVSACPGKKLA